MANEKHLEILKRGVKEWNAWRKEHPEIQPDLDDARLDGARLDGASLVRARLVRASLADASLVGASLVGAILDDARLDGARLDGARLDRASLAYARLDRASLDDAHLDGARLDRASLAYARLDRASLDDAHLDGARLVGTILVGVSLERASLNGASLDGAILYRASLDGAILDDAILAGTGLGDLDLSHAMGLEDVRHGAPSTIGTETLSRSEGKIPEVFLRGCGLSDWEIAAAKLYTPALSTDELTDITYEIHRLKGESPIQINPLFISYSHKDAPFVEALEKQLDAKRLRYWRDVHDLKAGRLETQIDRAIRHNPIVLLVLSEHSVESDWVEWEVSKARDLEKSEKRDVLCPVALDDAWKTCSWEGPLRRQVEKFNILDFSEWEDAEAMARQFGKLVDGLGLFYPGGSAADRS